MTHEELPQNEPASNQARIVHDLLASMQNPPSDENLTIAYAIANFLRPYSDNSVVDTGFGFSESCLDFWLDGKALRVIVKSVHELDGQCESNDQPGVLS